jgi:hypothetical protein
VVRPERCKWLNYEGEIAIVIGRTCRNIAPSEAGDYIAGYSVANDYGLHDFRDTDAGSMLRVKGSDTLCPIGPGLVTGWDFHDKRIRTYVNGELRQDDTTANMEWDMHYLVADIARTITLEPGDVLLGHAGEQPPGAARRSRRSRSRGWGVWPTGSSMDPRRSATIAARSRPNPRKSSPPRWAATGSSGASARRADRARSSESRLDEKK